MTAGVVAILLFLAVGWPLATLLDPDSRWSLRSGLAFLLGSGASGLLLLVLSLAGVRWSLASLLLSVALVAGAGWVWARRSGIRIGRTKPPPERRTIVGAIADFLCGVLVAGYALFATRAPTVEYDFIGIWGVKAREFWVAGGIDWRFLENPFNEFAHVDYPILLPLVFDAQTLIRGVWDDRWLGLLFVAWGVAALFVARSFLIEEGGRTLASLATLAVMSAAFSPWIGLAEGPLVACGTGGLLFIRRGLREARSRDLLCGSVLLGLAGLYKNEGLALLVAAAVAIALSAPWRHVGRLWPAALIAGSWVVLRSAHHLETDLTTGPMSERIVQHLHNLRPMFEAIATYTLGKPLFWTGIALALLLNLPRAVRRERFLLTTIVVQIGFYLAAYVATPHDVTWHIRWSWERIVNQVSLALAFLAIVLVMPELPRFHGGPPALGRPREEPGQPPAAAPEATAAPL
jgi:hypothetical protein